MSLLKKIMSCFTLKSPIKDYPEKNSKDFNAVVHSAENAEELKSFFSALNQKNNNPPLENIDFTTKSKTNNIETLDDLNGKDDASMKQDLNEGLASLNIENLNMNEDQAQSDNEFPEKNILEKSNTQAHEDAKEIIIKNLKAKFPDITLRSNYWYELTNDFSEEKLHEIFSYAVQHNLYSYQGIINIIDNGKHKNINVNNDNETNFEDENSFQNETTSGSEEDNNGYYPEDDSCAYNELEEPPYDETAENSQENTTEKNELQENASEVVANEQSKNIACENLHTPAIVEANSTIAQTQIKTNLAKMNSLPAKEFAKNLISNGYRCGQFCIHYNICHFRLTDDKNVDEKNCLNGIVDYLNKNTEIVEDVK